MFVRLVRHARVISHFRNGFFELRKVALSQAPQQRRRLLLEAEHMVNNGDS